MINSFTDSIFLPALLGFFLDLLLGDPRWLPHPIRLYGKLIAMLEKWLNCGSHRKLKGALMAMLLVGGAALFFWGTLYVLKPYPILTILFSTLFFFYGISSRCLIEEGLKVARKLLKDDLEGARLQLSQIVGRDTTNLSPNQIRIATLETLSENLGDGVVAPLFFYALGGIPLMMAFKMVSTLDSMVGYKNSRYIDFGCFSARLDDVANYIPARLTALFMLVLVPKRRVYNAICCYHAAHASPNSAYPESALAGILSCRFGGGGYYHGAWVAKPYIGSCDRTMLHADIIKACWINFFVAVLMMIAVLVSSIIFYFY